MPAPATDIGSDPVLQQQLERSRARLLEAPRRRERRVEALAAGLFVLIALGVALAGGAPAPDPVALVVLVAAYVLALRIEFEVGTGFTAPTMLVLVPMLYLLPPALVPLCVLGALLAGHLVNVALGRRHIRRIVIAFGQGWYSIGPALVFMAASPGAASWDDLPLVLAAFVAYVAFDAAASLSVDVLGLREPLDELVGPALWVYLVDLLLLPIGLMATIAADGDAAFIAALLPVGALLAIFGGERRRRIDQALELSSAYRGTAILLGDVVEHDDDYTGAHSRDVVELALAVGRRLRLGGAQLRDLEFGALLHDVGKIAVPNQIINKPGKLDEDEWAIMRRHTIEGQRMLESVGGVLTHVGIIVRASHERYDGGGYPDGVAGDAIPIEARICCACDAFSAMTTDRSYRAALPLGTAIAELRANAGTQFDPDVVDALVAEVAETRGPALRPIVQIPA